MCRAEQRDEVPRRPAQGGGTLPLVPRPHVVLAARPLSPGRSFGYWVDCWDVTVLVFRSP